MIVGAIYGSIEGYYGGKTDLIMERLSDILSAVPMMIVITLLKYHMGTASQILVLFISFFLTGWIGMAGRRECSSIDLRTKNTCWLRELSAQRTVD